TGAAGLSLPIEADALTWPAVVAVLGIMMLRNGGPTVTVKLDVAEGSREFVRAQIDRLVTLVDRIVEHLQPPRGDG
ncbi:MAG: hypothetical protein ABIO70_23450, partial [Pseudomonadota bacterium]